MILTKEQIEKRLSSESNIANRIEEVRLFDAGRDLPEVIYKDGKNHNGRPGATNLTESEKVAIGVLANTVGNETAAELMGVSENTARHLRSGQTTLSHGQGTQRYGEDTELRNKIDERLNRTKLSIEERAAEKLLGAMGLLTNEKLENCSAKDLAHVSSQMSQVMRNMNSNNNKESGKIPVKIIVHQPKTAREESFEMIEIGVG